MIPLEGEEEGAAKLLLPWALEEEEEGPSPKAAERGIEEEGARGECEEAAGGEKTEEEEQEVGGVNGVGGWPRGPGEESSSWECVVRLKPSSEECSCGCWEDGGDSDGGGVL